MHTVFTVEICGHHRPMKSHQPELIEKPCLHGCQIAVSKKRFGIGANDFQVQLFEQIIRSVTATGSKYSAYLRIGESPMQIVQPRGWTICIGLSPIRRYAEYFVPVAVTDRIICSKSWTWKSFAPIPNRFLDTAI